MTLDKGHSSMYVISVIWCGFVYIFEFWWCYLTQFWKTSCYTLSWRKILNLFPIFSLVLLAHHIVKGYVDFRWCVCLKTVDFRKICLNTGYLFAINLLFKQINILQIYLESNVSPFVGICNKYWLKFKIWEGGYLTW